MNRSEAEVWCVDSIEGSIAILVEVNDDAEPAVIEMAAGLLGDGAVEGAVLVVPLGDVGEPLWLQAERDLEREAHMREEAGRILEELRARDPGGDVSL